MTQLVSHQRLSKLESEPLLQNIQASDWQTQFVYTQRNQLFCFSDVLTCLSLCNTQARAVNLIPAILCNDEGVAQARGC